MFLLGEGSAVIEQQQMFLAAHRRRCGSTKSTRRVFSFSGCKREDEASGLLDNNKYLFFTVSASGQ